MHGSRRYFAWALLFGTSVIAPADARAAFNRPVAAYCTANYGGSFCVTDYYATRQQACETGMAAWGQTLTPTRLYTYELPDGFTIRYCREWLWDEVAGAHYATSYYFGFLQTAGECPANSTDLGPSCQCDPGFDEVTSPPDDDGITTTTCEPCACVCDAPIVDDVFVDVGPHGATLGVGCPVIGGDASLSSDLAGSVSMTPPSCANGCSTSASGDITLGVELALCDERGSRQRVEVSVSGSSSSRGCPECVPGTCVEACGAGGCVTETGGGSVSVGASRRFGSTAARRASVGGAEVRLQCAVTVSGDVSMSGDVSETSGSLPCDTCTQCLERSFEFTGSASGSGSCFVSGSVGGSHFQLLAKDLAAGEVSATGTHNLRSGECGDDYCADARADVKLRATTPRITLPGVRWFKPIGGLVCSLEADACSESNSCGACTCEGCSDLDTTLSCGVKL